MISVPVVSRTETDGWNVEDSGLPARVVHCCAAAGVRTVGELRTWTDEQLLSLRCFGTRSLRATRSFFRCLKQLEKGTLAFEDLSRIFLFLLLPEQWQILNRRFGLHRDATQASSNFYTLQELANERGVTRERVRQTQEDGLQRLRSRLAVACLTPVIESLRAYLAEAGGVRPETDFVRWPGRDDMAGAMNSVAAPLLIAEALPDRISHRHGCFTTAPAGLLDDLMAAAGVAIASADGVLTLGEVAALVRDPLNRAFALDPERALAAILAHMPSVAATNDERYAARRHVDRLLVETALRMGDCFRYGQLAEEFNRRVHPRSQLTGSAVLTQLNRSAHFAREVRGLYRLSDETAARPPDDLTGHAD